MFEMSLNTYGTVIGINKEFNRIAVKLHDGDISVMGVDKLSNFAINHVLYGRLNQATKQLIFNKTVKTDHYINIEATGCNFETAYSFLFSI
jgi:hypothetical protein